jgi:hypothetical protein
MENIIKELNHCFNDETLFNSREYYQICKMENKLRKRLKPKDERLFFAYTEACGVLSQQYAKEDFKRGFIAGCNFLLNMMSKN